MTEPLLQDHRQLAKGTLVNVLGVFAKTSRALYLVVFSRLLGSELFGLYMLAFAFQEIVGKVAVLGLDQGAMRYVARLSAGGRRTEIRPAVEKIFILCVVGSGLVAAAMGFSAKWIAEGILHQPTLASPLRNFAFGMPAVCATSVLLFAIRPSLKMQYEVYVRSVLEPLLILGIGLLALKLQLKVVGLVFAHNLAAFLSLGLALFFFFRNHPASAGRRRKETRLDWGFLINTSLPMGGAELLSMFKNRLDLMVIGRFLPLSSVGIYGAVTEIGAMLKKSRTAFEPVLLPMAQMLHEKKEMRRFKENLALVVRWGMVFSLLIIGPMLLVPKVFLFVFGRSFEEGAVALSIFAVGQFFQVTLGILEGVLQVTGFAYAMLVNSVLLVAGNAFLLFFLVPKWGLVGAALATTTSFVVVTVWRLIQGRMLLHMWPFTRAQLKPLASFLAALGIAGTLVGLVHPTSFAARVACALLFVALYGGGLFLLRLEATDKDVLGAVRRRISRKRGARNSSLFR